VTPLEALLNATAAGVRLSVNPATQKLVVAWDVPLDPDILAALKEHRDWLVAHLLQPPKPPVCRACGRPQHEPDIICGPELCPTWEQPDPNFAIAAPFVPLEARVPREAPME
jgi:hypothetical protein